MPSVCCYTRTSLDTRKGESNIAIAGRLLLLLLLLLLYRRSLAPIAHPLAPLPSRFILLCSKPGEEKSYELPDGTVIKVGGAREKLCELLFRPEMTETYRASLLSRQSTAFHVQMSAGLFPRFQLNTAPESEKPKLVPQPLPLHRLIHHSISLCPPELRRDLCGASE
jgi:hypothetical protein